MLTARIEFKPEHAKDFCPGERQTIVETSFESVTDLIETLKEFEHCVANCTATVGGRVIDLRSISGH